MISRGFDNSGGHMDLSKRENPSYKEPNLEKYLLQIWSLKNKVLKTASLGISKKVPVTSDYYRFSKLQNNLHYVTY